MYDEPPKLPENNKPNFEARYKMELASDFERCICLYLGEFYAELKRNRHIAFGPVYESKLKNGDAVHIHTAVIERPKILPIIGIVALNQDNKIIGLRELRLVYTPESQRKESNKLEAIDGWVITQARGQGLHVLLESVASEMLQICANKTDQKINWSVSNAVDDQLQDLIEENTEPFNDEERSYHEFLVQKARESRDAWLATYRTGGRLGFRLDQKNNAHRELEPPRGVGIREFRHAVMQLDAGNLASNQMSHYDIIEEKRTWQAALSPYFRQGK